MKRKDFIKQLSILPLMGSITNLKDLSKISDLLTNTETMPLLFLGHGSPMNAIEENQFVKGFRDISKTIPKPSAILCISAHWETKGTKVTAMEFPKTIHDFGGFPKALFDVEYPAPGSPEIAELTKTMITSTTIELDHSWGLDHGAWSVIKHLYPEANIPVIQMSIDYSQPAQYHYDLAKEMERLRAKGVLIIGSGNLVHNLGKVDWANINKVDHGFDWALEAKEKMNNWILEGNHQELINFKNQGKAFDLAIPTPEHYLPLLYVLGLSKATENIELFNDHALAGSLTMTSLKIG
ncbi:MAG: 4,5-DOPA dioxygenase extradiol [Flavobacteriales bacterium]|nr:4,5-DOPA dioxygenase extradiol [Flavobacteriales bacterium]